MAARNGRTPTLMDDSAPKRLEGVGHAEWIRIGDLKVDDRYQRTQISHARVARIAEHFDSDLLGVIDVARRPNGDFVIDGQHRVLAMKARGLGDHAVLCNVRLSVGVKREAEIFWRQNQTRKALTAYDLWRSKLVAGEEMHVAFGKELDALGIEVVGSMGRNHMWVADEAPRLWAIKTALDIFELDPEIFHRAASCLIGAWSKHANLLHSDLLKGMSYFVAEHSAIVTDRDVTLCLAKSTPDDVLDTAWQMKGHRKWSTAAYVAYRVEKIYNERRSVRRVPERSAQDYAMSFRAYRATLEGAAARASEWLAATLRAQGPMATARISELAVLAGFSEDAVSKARSALVEQGVLIGNRLSGSRNSITEWSAVGMANTP